MTPAQVQEQVDLLSSLLRDGVSIDDLELQFAGNYQPTQWQQIRAGALKRSSFTNS